MHDHTELLRRYLRALEGFAPPDELRGFFTADAAQDELPNRLFPEGRHNALAAMMAASQKGAKVLREQTYTLRNVVVAGDEVATEIEWRGTLREGFGAIAAGTSLRAALGTFFTFREGKIAHVRSYDCYFPF